MNNNNSNLSKTMATPQMPQQQIAQQFAQFQKQNPNCSSAFGDITDVNNFPVIIWTNIKLGKSLLDGTSLPNGGKKEVTKRDFGKMKIKMWVKKSFCPTLWCQEQYCSMEDRFVWKKRDRHKKTEPSDFRGDFLDTQIYPD